MIGRGDHVRQRREALGLSREQVSADTRIPVEHIASLEAGDLEALPAGPYADAWLRALEQHLGLPSPEGSATAPGAPARAPRPVGKGAPPGTPLWVVRAVAGVALGVLVAAIVWRVVESRPDVPVEPVATDAADQELLVRVLRNTSLKVVADGAVVREGRVAGGDEFEVRAVERIELDVQAAGALRIDYNGDRIVPQGRQDEPRRLVFVDDRGATP